MADAAWTLAIDFGTSNSAAAHSGATSGGIETLSLSHASHLMPSAVYVEHPDRISVGDAAVNQAQRDPSGFVAAPKRLIGGQPTVTVNGHTFPVSMMVAAVIGAIVHRGTAAHAGTPPSRLILTHPEAWSPQQIQVLVDAAVRAGIPAAAISTISEPRAAAAHYSRSHAMHPGARIAVFDFGGGTLDVAVLTVAGDSTFRVVAARGDNGLGGKNIDAVVARWAEERLGDRDPTLVQWLRREATVDVVQQMQDSIRRGKELLSEAPSATITVPTPQGRQTLQLTRDEFDEMIAPAVDQAIRLTRATLLDAGIHHPDQLTALYLTGGSSRIPLIQHRLGELGPVATLDDPKTVVAQGAAVTARAASAGTGNRGVPVAAQLMPAWQQQRAPMTGAPRPPTASADGIRTDPPGKRRWGRLAGVTVGVVATMGIAAGAVALIARDDAVPPTPRPEQSTAATAAGDTGKDGGRVIDDETALLDALPTALRSSTTECRKSGFTANDALQMSCQIADDSELAPLMTGDGPVSDYIMFNVDDNQAQSEIVNLRNGIYTNGDGELLENSARTAAGEITEDPSAGFFKVRYARTGDGLVASIYGLESLADARTFLTRSGLI
ncbi:Hsp70 family protein [Gordonia sp. LSe1-13]|uniref:Hsp70 family protein n=1 Tax=Gordonia sesuvii TaxID=3116777 RepID=A0ABU7MAX2_9ACTN|nr:Hsp70 family protein [Gordonia sp. LSe1-13]